MGPLTLKQRKKQMKTSPSTDRPPLRLAKGEEIHVRGELLEHSGDRGPPKMLILATA
jgi:hypothetical protein